MDRFFASCDDSRCVAGLRGELGSHAVRTTQDLLPSAYFRECESDSRSVLCSRLALVELQLLSRTRQLLVSPPLLRSLRDTSLSLG